MKDKTKIFYCWKNTDQILFFKEIEKFRIWLKSFTYSQALVPSSLIEAEQPTYNENTQKRELIEYNVETFQQLALLILVLGSSYIYMYTGMSWL